MTAEKLGMIAGVALSLFFRYIPGVRKWYDGLETERQQALMGILLVIVVGSIFGLSCYDIINTVTCDKAGVLGLIEVLILALTANQSTYQITRKKRQK